MRYLAAGSGPPILLLHGLMGYSFSWSEVIPELAQSHRVLAVDAINVGLSDRGVVDASFESIARRMLALMDAEGLDQATVVGTSHGGAIAMTMAILAPERIERLVLVAPAHPWSERDRWQIKLFSSFIGAPLAWMMSHTAWAWMPIGLCRMYFKPSRMRRGTVPGYIKPMRDSRSLAYLLRIARSWTRDVAWLESRFEVLAPKRIDLIWGEDDVVVPLSTAVELQHALPHATLHRIASCGHMPYEEHPQEFLTCLRRALA